MPKKEVVVTPGAAIPLRTSLVAKFADKYSIEPEKLMGILKATAFKQRDNAEVSNEQMAALLVVADQYGLNPFTKEIFAFPDKQNGIVPVVGVDGWSRIINENPNLDGIEFNYSDETVTHKTHTCHKWIECVIHRKDRSRPIVVREFFDEVMRELSYKSPWDTHPNRMHRHKTLIQCSRIAFGFVGIFDEDEAQRIIERDITPERQRPRELEVKTDSGHEDAAKSIDAEQKILPAHEKVLRAAMENATITEAEVCKRFEIDALPNLPFVKLNQVMEWVQNPA